MYTYEGQWRQDQKHGEGKMVWSNGDIYVGRFENNLVIITKLQLTFFSVTA
jgi:hypothetical protein